MRPMSHTGLKPYYALLVFSSLCLSGCGWRPKISFPAPDGHHQIVILQPWLMNPWGFRIDLVTPNDKRTVYSQRGDVFIYFVHVCWSADSLSFALLATGSTTIDFAYDIKSNREIPFDRLKDAMAASIRGEYHLDRDKAGNPINPIDWASSHAAHVAFSDLHPEAVTK